jgi:hypothetical protein
LWGRRISICSQRMSLSFSARRTGRCTKRNDEWVDYPDGRHVLLDTLKTPLFDEHGKLCGLLGISRDITGREFVDGKAG